MTTKGRIRVTLLALVTASLVLASCSSSEEGAVMSEGYPKFLSGNPTSDYGDLNNLFEEVANSSNDSDSPDSEVAPDSGFTEFDDPEEEVDSRFDGDNSTGEEPTIGWLNPGGNTDGDTDGDTTGPAPVTPPVSPPSTPPATSKPGTPAKVPTPVVPTEKKDNSVPVITPKPVVPTPPSAPVIPPKATPVTPTPPVTPQKPSPEPTQTPATPQKPSTPSPSPVAPQKPSPEPTQTPATPTPPVTPQKPSPEPTQTPVPPQRPAGNLSPTTPNVSVDEDGFIYGELNTSGGQVNQDWIVRAKWNSDQGAPTALSPALRDSATIVVGNALTISNISLSTNANDFGLSTRTGGIKASAECVGAPIKINILKGSVG